jgi:hypothetical protein
MCAQSKRRRDLSVYSLVVLLIHRHMLCSVSAERGIDDVGYSIHYSIGASDPVVIAGVEFRAYENAWSVAFEAPYVDGVLIFALCHEPCPFVSSHYHLLECTQMLSVIQDPLWHNQYIASHAEDGQTLCEAIVSSPDAFQDGVNNILSDTSGGALLRLRSRHTLVIFNEPEVVESWMTNVQQQLSLSFRVTHIEVVGGKFGVRHFLDTVLLQGWTQRAESLQGVLTLALRNRCTAIGLSAPEFGSVRTVTVAGRNRCVWECRGDMIRQPYNSEPATQAQLDPSRPEHAILAVKYKCVQLPKVWVASVFGFTVETNLSVSDIGYAQTLFDAVDRLSLAVGRDLAAAGIEGVMLFSIKNTVYHTSFADRIDELQASACSIANVFDSTCTDGSSTVRNPDYVYGRRLLSSSEAQVEGLFISGDVNVFSQQSKREEHLSLLRTVLVSAIIQNSALLSDSNGSAVLRNIADIDFSEIVSFTVPTKTQNETPNPTNPTVPRTAADDVGNLLATIAGVVGCVIVFALCVTSMGK